MKVTEFESRLSTVSDAKLMQMLSASRANGPEVAVEMILAEGRRRGLEDFGKSQDDSSTMPAAVATSAYSREGAGAFGADAPASAAAEEVSGEPAFTDPLPSESGPAPAEWLSEETKKGLPVPVKVLLAVVVLGAIAAVAWKFAH
jgi:hypothetical protein